MIYDFIDTDIMMVRKDVRILQPSSDFRPSSSKRMMAEGINNLTMIFSCTCVYVCVCEREQTKIWNLTVLVNYLRSQHDCV